MYLARSDRSKPLDLQRQISQGAPGPIAVVIDLILIMIPFWQMAAKYLEEGVTFSTLCKSAI